LLLLDLGRKTQIIKIVPHVVPIVLGYGKKTILSVSFRFFSATAIFSSIVANDGRVHGRDVAAFARVRRQVGENLGREEESRCRKVRKGAP
jgi:hypothetical protein